jgi:hypothetical protein
MAAGDRRTRNFPLVRFGAGAMATLAKALLPVRITGKARNERIMCASALNADVRRRGSDRPPVTASW